MKQTYNTTPDLAPLDSVTFEKDYAERGLLPLWHVLLDLDEEGWICETEAGVTIVTVTLRWGGEHAAPTRGATAILARLFAICLLLSEKRTRTWLLSVHHGADVTYNRHAVLTTGPV